MYVIGGEAGSGSVPTVYRAAIDSSGNVGTFSTANQAQLPIPLRISAAVSANVLGTNYIYLTGGYTSMIVPTVYRAAIDSSGNVGTFSTANQAQLPQPIAQHTSVIRIVDGVPHIYVVGGGNGTSILSTVYKGIIDQSGNIPTLATTFQSQLPFATQAHNTVTLPIGNTTYTYLLGGIGGTSIYKATPAGSQTTPTPTVTLTPTPTQVVPTSTPTPTPSATLNLLLNSSFELDTNNDSKPDNWTSHAKVSRSSTLARLGTYSMKLSDTGGSSFNIEQKLSNISPSNQYNVSSWVNVPSTGTFTFQIRIVWGGSNGTIRTDTVKRYQGKTLGWDNAFTTLTPPSGTTKATVRMQVNNLKGTIYADDFTFSKK
jgi:hypothetical protein